MNESKYQPGYDHSLFAELYDVQPQPVFWTQPIWNNERTSIVDFAYVYINNEGLAYLNMAPGPHKELRVSTAPFLNDALRKTVLQQLSDVYHTGQPSQSDLYSPLLNKYVRVLRTKLRDGVLLIIQDRTEENRIIHQLEEQKNLLNNILKNSSNGISVSRVFRNESGDVVDALTILANDAAVNYIGLPRDVYLTKRATEIEPAIIGSPYYQLCIKTLKTGEPFVSRYQMQSTGRWLELTVSKLDNDHLIQIFTDVTPTKQAQLQIEQAADRLEAVFNASQSGMFTFSPVRNEGGEIVDFRFVITNPTFAAYVGQTPDVLQGALGSTFFPGYLHNGVFDMYRHTYLTGETQRRDIHYAVDEHDLYLDLLSTKVHDEVLVTFTDYTAVKKAQLQLEGLIDDLQRSNKNLEEFAHAASHDLKEPIRKITVFLDRLEQGLNSRITEAERGIFARIQNAAQRMTLLVDDLLSYSHASITPVMMEDVDLDKKLQAVLSDLEVLLEEKKAVVNVDKLPVVKGYKRQLQQIFQNLLSNSLKYSKPGEAPVISISASIATGAESGLNVAVEDKPKRFHRITVQDNGIGFEQEYSEKIFNIFTRLHGNSEYSGTGIGLAIVKKVVDNHKGYISAEGEAGTGARFTVLLPA